MIFIKAPLSRGFLIFEFNRDKKIGNTKLAKHRHTSFSKKITKNNDIITSYMSTIATILKQKLSSIEKLFIIGVAFLYSSSPAFAQTAAWSGVCVGGADNDVATIQGLECLIANVFTVIITLIGLAAFVMFIIGSVRWLISGGNSSNVDKARNTMTYAVMGIVIALSAFIVINLIAGFTGVETIKTFRIPTSDDAPPTMVPAPPGAP